MPDIKLTQYSHGAGCGCKVSPAVLDAMLATNTEWPRYAQLLVGYAEKDDAAVYDIGDGKCIISTTDFFMPIVDDAGAFGSIASANAISDVYAMGGKPIMAVAILGWPIEKLPPALAQKVLDGSRAVCAEAGIPLAGGHSIDSPEPIFGLAVTGMVDKKNLKRNTTAQEGDLIYLTKPLGVGMVTTAHKRDVADAADLKEAIDLMSRLNTAGSTFGTFDFVTAMTDVTGFGFLGHLIEVCDGSNVSAEVTYGTIPLMANLKTYAAKMIYPDNTMRNWNSYQARVEGIGSESLLTLCDPQTSGGLLVCVDSKHQDRFESESSRLGMQLKPIGTFTKRQEVAVRLR